MVVRQNWEPENPGGVTQPSLPLIGQHPGYFVLDWLLELLITCVVVISE